MQDEHEPSILDNEDYNGEIEEIEETPQEEFDREEFQIIKEMYNDVMSQRD